MPNSVCGKSTDATSGTAGRKELFARHGRNKLLTEQGIQLLGYARKILRFNDEACMSLMFSGLQGILTIGRI
ncbi:DNA-binding transcriptional repressor LrhA [Raoultella planticola]|uniref:DNA-binding transcriptional repressor LrhA n=1 Tax=Raoultella planticola TaxID=575 RepID=A0A485C252_RAOPL|nr:DNA-binding transcriptional repressor LrhA [Raoultella planticola]